MKEIRKDGAAFQRGGRGDRLWSGGKELEGCSRMGLFIVFRAGYVKVEKTDRMTNFKFRSKLEV